MNYHYRMIIIIHTTIDKKKKDKKENPDLAEEEKAFFDYMISKFPRCAKMQRPLTLSGYNELVSKYGENVVLSKLEALENKKKIDYVDTKLTINNWCRLYGTNSGNIQSKPDIREQIIADFYSGQS